MKTILFNQKKERDELIEKLLRFYVREHGVKLD